MSVYKRINSLDTFKIRYNTAATSDEKCWRVINSEGKEYLVNSIRIERKCETTKDWIEETKEFKFHITTRGVLYVDESNNAIIEA